MLGPEQFGLAMTFIIAQQLLDTSTDAGFNKFLLQNRDGNKKSVQSMIQLLAVARGLIIATAILVFGPIVFEQMQLPSDRLPFFLLAGSALAMGFLHFDTTRQQRHQNFFQDSISKLAGEMAALICVLVAIFFVQSYLVALLAIFSRAVFTSLASHGLSDRRYQLALAPAYSAAIIAFSWPLIMNGPIVFISGQADRILVGATMGLEQLGIYSAVIMLVYLPLGLLSRIVGTLFLPRLAEEFRDANSRDVEREFSGLVVALSLAAGCGFACIGPFAIDLIYGEEYSLSLIAAVLIGLAQATRFLRTWPMTLALASAKTRNVLLSNTLRLLSLPVAFAFGAIIGGLEGLALGFLIGESIALYLALLAFNKSVDRPLLKGSLLFLIVFSGFLLVTAGEGLFQIGQLPTGLLAIAVLALCIACMHLVDRKLVPRDLSAFGW